MEKGRLPYLDENHLYNMYEQMRMANERNMQEKFKLEAELTEMNKKCFALEIENAKLSHLLSREDEKE